MSDEPPPSLLFKVELAKTARSKCKRCKQTIDKGTLRLGKWGFNHFAGNYTLIWHHVPCMFEVFSKQRKTTKKIDTWEDIEGWENLTQSDKDIILKELTPEQLQIFNSRTPSNESPSTNPAEMQLPSLKGDTKCTSPSASSSKTPKLKEEKNLIVKDNLFKTFRKICAQISDENSSNEKCNILKRFFEKGIDESGFKGDIQLWIRSLLPAVEKRLYNLQSKQIIKVFSNLLKEDESAMLEDLEQGDVAETIGKFFGKNCTPASKSKLTLQDVDLFLENISKISTLNEKGEEFFKIMCKCTVNDLKMIIRLIKHDLRINAGPKPILSALHDNAYTAFQSSLSLRSVVENSRKAIVPIGVLLMTPVLPMLAEVCKSAEAALEKHPRGLFAEVKYDGERVQIHKTGNNLKFYSRSLKIVLEHKIAELRKFILEAFPSNQDIILDSEILMVDTITGQPLPFGTLGKHKKTQFKDACTCLFVFDCLYLNGSSLMNVPLKKRKEILHANMKEFQHRIMFSETNLIDDVPALKEMMTNVFRQGLEGLVLKPIDSLYQPGKRRWLKMKKDYLAGMADTADLLVLGAWYGTGKKGGMMSVFLMGCRDSNNKWRTVTKVMGGLDDETLERLQKELDMVKLDKGSSKVPSWLVCNKKMIPDFVANDPKNMPVWEITGAEFTCTETHTAEGISIRFPRISRMRKDKNWETATTLEELKTLYNVSRDSSQFSLSNSESPSGKSSDSNQHSPKKKNQPHTLSPFKNHLNSSNYSPQNSKRTGRNSPEKEFKKMKYNEVSETAYDVETDVDTEVEEEIQPTMVMSKPFPDVFLGNVFLLPDELPQRDKLRKYIIALGGKIYSKDKNTTWESNNLAVTHLVASGRTVSFENALSVTSDWIWQKIQKSL